MSTPYIYLDLELPYSKMTPTERVNWTILGAASYVGHGVHLQYVQPRWGIYGATQTITAGILHICNPRMLYKSWKDAYYSKCRSKWQRVRFADLQVVANLESSRVRTMAVQVRKQPIMNYAQVRWEWNNRANRIANGGTRCSSCKVDAPREVVGHFKLLQLRSTCT
jgi:hypothetical protein